MTARSFCAALAVLISSTAFAQYVDQGLWTSITGYYDYSKRLSVDAELQNRFGQGMSRYQTTLLDLGGSYQLNRMFRVGMAYRMGHRLRHDDRQDFRQRLNTDIRLRLRSGKVRYDFRVRYQAGPRNSTERVVDLREAMRYRLKISGKIARKTHLALAGELFQSKRNGEFGLSDWRAKAEVFRKIGGGRSISAGYLVQRELNREDPLLEHVLVLGYAFGGGRKNPKPPQIR